MYGNSKGRNKGKKYVKLTGDEIATAEGERRARNFMNWYGAIYPHLIKSLRDPDLDAVTDTMLQIYNDILYKGLTIDRYSTYFKRAYHTTKLKAQINATKQRERTVSIDAPCIQNGQDNGLTYAETIAAPDFDFELFESINEQVQNEMLEYVRANFAPMEVSLFEIYIGLQPDVSYPILGKMLGISANRIYLTISAIKRDLQQNYTDRRIYLLSTL